AGVLGDAVGGGQGEIPVDGDLGLGVEAVADPADAQHADPLDAGDAGQHGPGLVAQGGVDGVHESVHHVPGRCPQHRDDQHRDGEAGDGVGPVEPGRHPDGAGQDAEGADAVGAGVEAVGDQGGGADLPPDPDPVAGHELVAGDADEGGGDDGAEV